MDAPITIPFLKVFDNKFHVVFHNNYKRIYPENQGENLQKDRVLSYNGLLSKSAERLILERLTAWFNVCDAYNSLPVSVRGYHFKKLVFITLTLSEKQCMSDMDIKAKLLDMFLDRLLTTFGKYEYFWRAEKQKNGNIHFHLILDLYIDKLQLRSIWNGVQDYYGLLDNFEKKYHHKNPNSTDIKLINSKTGGIGYISKYVQKQKDEVLVQGRLYSFSKGLVHLKIPMIIIDSYVSYFIDKCKSLFQHTVIQKDYFVGIYFKQPLNLEFFQFDFLRILRNYYKDYALLLYVKETPEEIMHLFELKNFNFPKFAEMISDKDLICEVRKYFIF